MHRSRRTIAASVSVSMALATSVAIAHADDTSVLYVNNLNTAHCTDTGSGAGSAATPFCTIQAAADAATAGDTVDIAKGSYAGADITSAGTAQAPIVFQATGGGVTISNAAGSNVLSFDGASYVEFEGAEGIGALSTQRLTVTGVVVNNSSHITLDSIRAVGSGYGVHVTGSSSDVAITRGILAGMLGSAVIDAGSTGDVVSTNEIEVQKLGISVEGAADTALTSNSFIDVTTGLTPIQVGQNATGTSIENNVVVGPAGGTGAAISVDSTAEASTTDDYNVVWPYGEGEGGGPESAYSWGGVDYTSQSSLTAATGQGEHDLVADPHYDGQPFTRGATAPQLNSANAAAPGMLQTDLFGEPCATDPIVAVPGAPSPTYCARGALQQGYSAAVHADTTPENALSVDLDSSMSATTVEENETLPLSSVPTPAVSYVVNWGDGTTSAPVPGASNNVYTGSTHTYAKLGTYTITDTAELTDGSTAVTTTSFTTAGSGYTSDGPVRLLDTRKGTGAPKAKIPSGGSVTVKVAGAQQIPANVTAVALNLTVTDATGGGYLSAGTKSTSNVNYSAGQTVANSLIAPVTNGSITIYNTADTGSTDIVADVSGYFTQAAGDGYSPVPLARVLNTRTGTGAAEAKVAAGKGIPVTVAGFDSIPSGVKAVAVHITVADTTGTGWVAGEPDGAGTPGTSSLDYGPNQIISNTVIVPVASDGKIELYNGGGDTPVDLIADVSGYFSAGAPDAYVPISPLRVWDTRKIAGSTIPSGVTAPAYLGSNEGDGPNNAFPENAILAANTTVTNTRGGGYLTVYPGGTSRPTTSNLNFNAGQTVAGFGILGTGDPEQEVEVTNSSTGSADVVFDIFGYFANS